MEDIIHLTLKSTLAISCITVTLARDLLVPQKMQEVSMITCAYPPFGSLTLRGPVFFKRRDPGPPPLQPQVFEKVASRKASSDWSTIYRDKNGGQ